MKKVPDDKRFDFYPVGEALKRAREDTKTPREVVAEKADITPRFLTAIENEGRSPNLDRCILLVKLFGISMDEFIYADSEKNPSSISTVRRQFLNIIGSLSDEKLHILKPIFLSMIATINAFESSVNKNNSTE